MDNVTMGIYETIKDYIYLSMHNEVQNTDYGRQHWD